MKGGTGVTQWASPASQMPTLATGSPSNFKHDLSGFGCLHMLKQCACSKSSDLFISRKLMSSFKKDNNQKHKRKSVTDGLNILSSLLQMLACPAN